MIPGLSKTSKWPTACSKAGNKRKASRSPEKGASKKVRVTEAEYYVHRDFDKKERGKIRKTLESVVQYRSRHYEQLDKGSFGAIHRVGPDKCKIPQACVFKTNLNSDGFRLTLKEAEFHISIPPRDDIVQCLGYGVLQSEQCVYILMPEVKEALDERLISIENSNVSMDWKKRLKLLQNIATGLDYLHGESYVHCDIASKNILITTRGQAQLCDFGCAYRSGAINGNQWMPGDPNCFHFRGNLLYRKLGVGDLYRAPELYYGKKINPASDLFGFGLLFTNLLQGKHFWVGWSNNLECELGPCKSCYSGQHELWPPAKITCIRSYQQQAALAPPDKRPKDIAPQVLHQARKFASQCLDLDPDERPTSAMAVQRLNRLLDAID